MGSTDVIIRKATREDVPQILGLIKELAAYENMLDRVKIDEQTLTRDGFDSNPPAYTAYVVADKKNPAVLIGYAIGNFTYATWLGRRFYIEDIIITEKYKQKGIGSKLLGFICKEALEHGCVIVNFVVLDWNPAAKFYLKMGALNSSEKNGWQWYEISKANMEKLAKDYDQ